MYLRYFNDGGETDAQQSFADMYRELSTPDKQRLWAVVGDIAALVNPEPISSVGMGLASDYLNTKADVADNGWSWQTAKNLATNIGLTALGAIPVVGQALGSGTKAVRTLLKLTPWLTKAATVAAAAGIISNGPEMVRSLENLSNGDYTIDDIRNAGMMLQTLLSGANALKLKSMGAQSMRNRGNRYSKNAEAALDARDARVLEDAVIQSQIKSNNGNNYLLKSDNEYWRGHRIVEDPSNPYRRINVVEYVQSPGRTQTAVLGYPRFFDHTLPRNLQALAIERQPYKFEFYPGTSERYNLSEYNSYSFPIENIRLSDPARFNWGNSQFSQYAIEQRYLGNLYYQLSDMFSGFWPRRIAPIKYASIKDVHNWY